MYFIEALIPNHTYHRSCIYATQCRLCPTPTPTANKHNRTNTKRRKGIKEKKLHENRIETNRYRNHVPIESMCRLSFLAFSFYVEYSHLQYRSIVIVYIYRIHITIDFCVWCTRYMYVICLCIFGCLNAIFFSYMCIA